MRIFIESLSFIGRHGVYEEERRDGRRFCVDLSVDTHDASNDQLDTTVDYRGLASCILEVGHGPSVDLIETLGANMLQRVFETFPTIRAANIRLRKKATGVPGDPEWVGIELSQERS